MGRIIQASAKGVLQRKPVWQIDQRIIFLCCFPCSTLDIPIVLSSVLRRMEAEAWLVKHWEVDDDIRMYSWVSILILLLHLVLYNQGVTSDQIKQGRVVLSLLTSSVTVWFPAEAGYS